MHRRILSLALIGFLSIVIINWSCTKLDTTTLGSDLIPVVDNVNTFADTFAIDAIQRSPTDTTVVDILDDHALGNISNDPLFGKTEAKVFLNVKPDRYPFLLSPADTITPLLDSVVLCLSYQGFWGDSSVIQQLQVNEITDGNFRDKIDTIYNTDHQPAGIGAQVAPLKPVYMPDLNKYIVYANKRDSVRNQIRIKLDSATYGARLFGSDTSLTGPGNHAFRNDSIFRREFIGFAIKAVSGTGNALMYVNLADTNTKLEIHYRLKSATKTDTVYKSFKVATTTSTFAKIDKSPSANYIKRDRTGTPSASPGFGEVYLQTQPGTYADLSIPALTNYSNRIIHRAEIIVEQIPDVDSKLFPPPNFLYIDLKDSAASGSAPAKYKPVYIDLNPTSPYDPDYKVTSFYPTGGPDFAYFGGFANKKTGSLGAEITYYNFNVTRYVQRMVIDSSRNYDLRLFAPYRFRYPQYSGGFIPYNNSVGLGRLRVGNGLNPNYKMRIRIIYSPIK